VPTQTIFGLNAISETYSALRLKDPDKPITERLLDHLKVRYTLSARDLEHIPRKGPALVVANHPFGMLEGAVLATVLLRLRPDVKFLANSRLTSIPELRELIIPVDLEGSASANRAGLRAALEFLHSGGLLIVFPSGEVSHFQWRQRAITDPAWSPSIARMIRITARKGTAVPVIPVFIGGSNGLLFQTAGVVHPRLRTALLVRELLNKRSKTVDVRIGNSIDSAKLLAIPNDGERIEYMRWRTYLLANRSQFKPNTRVPLAGARKQLEPIASALDAVRMVQEISALELVVNSGDLEVYIASAQRIPTVLREIGRLRETTFRAVGEGTGKPCDLDRFDDSYLHLFLWNAAKREVAGAYRLGKTDGPLYTASLFQYGEEFLSKLGPALELGRSFIRVEYQKGFTPLLLLWKGIGKYVARNPQYKTLFGPVSISNQYRSISRELMVSFLERHASLRDWAGLVTSRNPFRCKNLPEVSNSVVGLDELSDIVSDLEPNHAGVPVLLRQYLRLGGKLLGFNVDPEFSNALDGLILVDLTQTEPKLLERYLGRTEAAQFLAFQERRNVTH